MRSVVVHPARRSSDQGRPRVSATIDVNGRRHEVYYRSSRGPLASGPAPFLAVALLPAMRLGAPVRVVDPLSPLLLENLDEFQTILTTWHGSLQRVPIVATPAAAPADATRPAGVGAFFSGGVDSFYTALKRQGALSAIIFVHGFDIGLDEARLRGLASDANRQAAAELGKPLVEVETNLRSVIDEFVDWNNHSHGTGLAAVALALAPQFGQVYISSTAPYQRLNLHGSHPLTDPLWSTESLRIVHEGCEVSRWQKLDRIVDNKMVQRYLRICFEHPNQSYNCGLCEHCQRMIGFLHGLGLRDCFTTFPRDVALDMRAATRLGTVNRLAYISEMLDVLDRRGVETSISRILRENVQRYHEEGLNLAVSTELQELENKIAEREAQLCRLHSSRSWQLFAPWRALAGATRRTRQGGAG